MEENFTKSDIEFCLKSDLNPHETDFYALRHMSNATRMLSGLVYMLVFVLTVCSSTIAQAPVFTESEIKFQNGPVVLSGTIILPAKPGQHPGIVFLHGSGPATRAGARPYAEEFAKLGVASLIFDKRGCGSSDGSWVTSSLDDLANDALSAVDSLQSQEDIDPKRVGFWGVSQAGWVATLAASAAPEKVDFMILISGGGASPRESELYSYKNSFENAGLSEEEMSEGMSTINDYFEFLATGDKRSELVARLDSVRDSDWYQLASLDRILPSEENRPNWSWVANWDPTEHMEKIKCPLLLLFGELDTDHPTSIAVEKWQTGLQKAGNDEVTLTVFPGAGHGIRMRKGHTGSGRPQFADGYSEIMLGWLWKHIVYEKK